VSSSSPNVVPPPRPSPPVGMTSGGASTTSPFQIPKPAVSGPSNPSPRNNVVTSAAPTANSSSPFRYLPPAPAAGASPRNWTLPTQSTGGASPFGRPQQPAANNNGGAPGAPKEPHANQPTGGFSMPHFMPRPPQ